MSYGPRNNVSLHFIEWLIDASHFGKLMTIAKRPAHKQYTIKIEWIECHVKI